MGESFAAHLRRQRQMPWDELPTGGEAFDQAMRPADQVVLLGFESKLLGVSISTERVAAQVARQPERYLGFASIDPTQPGSLSKLKDAVGLGMVGVTVSPSGQGFHPCHSDAMRLFEACAERGLPILFEPLGAIAGPANMEFDRPSLLDDVARAIPALRFVLGSMADPFVDEALALMGKHPQVFAEVSGLLHRPWQLYHALVGARERGVMQQMLFGSGFPFCDAERAIVTLYSVNGMTQGTPLPNVPREQLRSIVQRDTITALGLPYREARVINTERLALTEPNRTVTLVEEPI